MIIGIGTDLCAVERMRRQCSDPDSAFLAAAFTPQERAAAGNWSDPAAHFAACFAAKEAVVKALAAAPVRGVFWQEIEVRRGARGRDAVELRGRMAAAAARLGVTRVWIACAHDGELATAQAVAEGDG